MTDESVEKLRSQVSARIDHIKKLNGQAKAIIDGFATKENTINGTG